MKAYVEAVEAVDMLDVTGFGDADGRYAPSGITIRLRTKTGCFWIPWHGAQPLVGACIALDVENAQVVSA